MKIETLEKANELLEKIKRAESELHIIEKDNQIKIEAFPGMYAVNLTLNDKIKDRVRRLIIMDLKKEIQALNHELKIL